MTLPPEYSAPKTDRKRAGHEAGNRDAQCTHQAPSPECVQHPQDSQCTHQSPSQHTLSAQHSVSSTQCNGVCNSEAIHIEARPKHSAGQCSGLDSQYPATSWRNFFFRHRGGGTRGLVLGAMRGGPTLQKFQPKTKNLTLSKP